MTTNAVRVSILISILIAFLFVVSNCQETNSHSKYTPTLAQEIDLLTNRKSRRNSTAFTPALTNEINYKHFHNFELQEKDDHVDSPIEKEEVTFANPVKFATGYKKTTEKNMIVDTDPETQRHIHVTINMPPTVPPNYGFNSLFPPSKSPKFAPGLPMSPIQRHFANKQAFFYAQLYKSQANLRRFGQMIDPRYLSPNAAMRTRYVNQNYPVYPPPPPPLPTRRNYYQYPIQYLWQTPVYVDKKSNKMYYVSPTNYYRMYKAGLPPDPAYLPPYNYQQYRYPKYPYGYMPNTGYYANYYQQPQYSHAMYNTTYSATTAAPVSRSQKISWKELAHPTMLPVDKPMTKGAAGAKI